MLEPIFGASTFRRTTLRRIHFIARSPRRTITSSQNILSYSVRGKFFRSADRYLIGDSCLINLFHINNHNKINEKRILNMYSGER